MYRLECLGPEEVGFVSTGMAWIVGKSVLHRLERFGMNEVGFAVGRSPKICNGQEEEEKKEISSSKTRCNRVAPGLSHLVLELLILTK